MCLPGGGNPTEEDVEGGNTRSSIVLSIVVMNMDRIIFICKPPVYQGFKEF